MVTKVAKIAFIILNAATKVNLAAVNTYKYKSLFYLKPLPALKNLISVHYFNYTAHPQFSTLPK